MEQIAEGPKEELDIPELSKDNYGTWKVKIEKHLKSVGLWGEDPNDFARQARVRTIIRQKCGEWVLPYIEGVNVNSVWKQLEIMFKNADETLRTTGIFTNYTWWLPLYTAIINGDLMTVVQLVLKNKSVLNARLTSEGEYPLHVAVKHQQVKIVEKMVEMMEPNELARTGKFSKSALHIAASNGNLNIVKVLVEKHEDLVTLTCDYYEGEIPLTVAARAGNKDVVYYLYRITLQHDCPPAEEKEKNIIRAITIQQDGLDRPLEKEKKKNIITAGLLTSLIFGDFFDLASHLLERYPNLLLKKDANGYTALGALSMKPSAFPSSFLTAKSGIRFLKDHVESIIYSILDVDDKHNNLSLQTIGDVENPSKASQDNVEGGDGITVRFHKGLTLWFHELFGTVFKLVPYYKVIYDMKLKHHWATKLLKDIWKQVSKIEIRRLVEDEPVKALFQASEFGIIEFLDEVICHCPQLLLQTYPELEKEQEKSEEEKEKIGQTIFHYAVTHRQGKIFNRIHDLGLVKYDITRLANNSKNLMLHLAANLAPKTCLNQVPGAALQVQYELLWYKEVASIMPPSFEEFENNEGKTARILFTEKHQELVKEGAAWMKDTATQCMVVATLVTTIMFAAVSTVPGAKESDTGKPNYIHEKFSIVFVSANILALCSSVASMLIFLAIITSRYAEEDFLKRLPQMLILGLLFLFISIAGMMIEFVVAVLVLVHYNVFWVSFPIVFLASVPISIYAYVEIPLFIELTFPATRAKIFGVRK